MHFTALSTLYLAASAGMPNAEAVAISALSSLGFDVRSATRRPATDADDLIAIMRGDLAAVAASDAVVVMPGAEHLAEVTLAAVRGMPVLSLAGLLRAGVPA